MGVGGGGGRGGRSEAFFQCAGLGVMGLAVSLQVD